MATASFFIGRKWLNALLGALITDRERYEIVTKGNYSVGLRIYCADRKKT